MEDFKIEVKNQEESKEAQELFFELGFSWCDTGKNLLEDEYVGNYFIFAYGQDLDLTHSCNVNVFIDKSDSTEITLPQLRDMAVLHRNDVRDANAKDDTLHSLYLASDGVVYFYHAFHEKWVKSAMNGKDVFMSMVEKIEENNVENLISGKEALIALANGDGLQYRFPDGIWLDFTNNLNSKGSSLRVVDLLNDYAAFRLKPRTIKIGDVDVPAPFDPKGGDVVWYMDGSEGRGYSYMDSYSKLDTKDDFFGFWRTKEEIKQVVDALRKLIGVTK